MDDRVFEEFDQVADSAAETCAEFLKSAKVVELGSAIEKLAAKHGYSVSLTCGLEVYDAKRGHALPLMQISLTTSGGTPYAASADCSPQRYWLRGTICTVPHDRCPSCWGEWNFKFKHTSCGSCGVQMGNEVKQLLDSDICPHCEAGTITRKNPVCNKCGFSIDPNHVVWG